MKCDNGRSIFLFSPVMMLIDTCEVLKSTSDYCKPPLSIQSGPVYHLQEQKIVDKGFFQPLTGSLGGGGAIC